MNTGVDAAFAATIRHCLTKPTIFTLPYGRRLYSWLRTQGAEPCNSSSLKRGKVEYRFEPMGDKVKLTIEEVANA